MLHFNTHGKGDHAIIFIHGNSQSHSTWKAVLDTGRLAQYYCIIMDMPGHGRSPVSQHPSTEYTLTGIAQQLVHFINSVCSGNFIAVCTSLASNLFAEALPHLPHCKGGLFIGASVIGSDLSIAKVLQPNPDALVAFTAHPTAEQLERYIDCILLDKTDVAGRDAYKQSFQATDPAFRQVLAESVDRGEWADELANIRNAAMPLAVVYGAQEAVVNTDYLASANLTFWRDNIIMVDNAGHSVQLDQPSVIASLIDEFATDCFI